MTDQRYMRPGINHAVGKTIEEAGEVLSALGKTMRFGWDGVNPELPADRQETNAGWVEREVVDLRGALTNLEEEMRRRSRLPPVERVVRDEVARLAALLRDDGQARQSRSIESRLRTLQWVMEKAGLDIEEPL